VIRLTLFAGGAVWGALWIAGIGTAPAQGQVVLEAPAAGDDKAGDLSRVKPVTKRTESRGMRRAQESIAAGEYSQAVQFLDHVLARDEDLFVEAEGESGYAGQKETARQLIRDLPPEGRQAYEAA
jgi:hypothetical protein